MDPQTSHSDNPAHDEDVQSAPTSPWTDALHQAWTPGYEVESADEDLGMADYTATDALNDAFNG